MKRNKLISIALILSLIFTMVFTTTSTVSAGSYAGTYWLKVNEQRNVVTAYKKIDGKWKPWRAMLCSTGIGGATPKGTFYTQGRWNWGLLMNDVYGQYCTHITDDILFHSVYYTEGYDKSSQPTSQFNLLGSAASHGCIRLSVMDAKWIYENCKAGTKVTIYRSSYAGPLGKPEGITVSQSRYQYWDPTDPDPANPYYRLKKPIITISSKKKTEVQYGSAYKLKNYVNAKDPNTSMNLKDRIKVSKVRKWSSAKKRYVSARFSTKKLGTYKITYTVNDPYSGKASQTIKIKVVDNKAPVISGAKSRTVTWGDTNAVGNVTAKQATANRTNFIKVYIKEPGAEKYKIYKYSSAKKYKFKKTGKYSIKYFVKNKYKPYRSSTKIITITSKKGAVNRDPKLSLPPEFADAIINSGGTPLLMKPGAQADLVTGVKASHNGKDISSQIRIFIKGPQDTAFKTVPAEDAAAWTFTDEGDYQIKYSIKNRYTPYQTVSKIVTVRIETETL
ncbi:L,D-transpeptidase [Ihubacter sp. mB4P-1]|uniref:L,D-transpeptidase n=1 Tax=Ihubacter sp. mB4P-1 TaxID=3242370 RepID=UPI003C7D4AC3